MPETTVIQSYPLSPLQEGMLYQHLHMGKTGIGVQQIVVTLPGQIDTETFRAAWLKAMQRHAILRTSFRWEGLQRPLQDVWDAIDLDLSLLDWSTIDPNEQENSWQKLMAEDHRDLFQLTRPPLWRLKLVRLNTSEHRLLLSAHHILFDAHSIYLLLREAMGDPTDPATASTPPPPPYQAFIDWLEKRDKGADEDFWRQTLKGFTTPTELPGSPLAIETHSPEPAMHHEQTFVLDKPTSALLRRIARSNRCTMSILTMAAWALLLGRYNGSTDVVFGVIRSGRNVPVAKAMETVGIFINSVPLRVSLPAGQPVCEWLLHLRHQWAALRSYEQCPLKDIQKWSELPPGTPLFQTIVNYQEVSVPEILQKVGGVWTQRSVRHYSHPGYPISCYAEGGSELSIGIRYDSHRYTSSSIQLMLGHLKTLLQGIAANPECPIEQLPMLTAAERRQILYDWNRTEAVFPKGGSLHQLVAGHAANTPGALAVADPHDSLTYQELNTRANALAQTLLKSGAKPETCVAICLPRSAGSIVALLAVLKTGAAYLPLDPNHPAAHRSFMVNDSRAVILLTTPELTSGLSVSAQIITVDGEGDPKLLDPSETEPAHRYHPTGPALTSRLAYIIYTSGSLGKPKGTAVEHRSLLNLIFWHQRQYQVTSADRASHVASPAFDASVWEIWPYLACGASVHIAAKDTQLNPTKLIAWIAEQKISLCFLPTPMLEMLLQEQWPEKTRLRAILTGGDQLRRRPDHQLPCPLYNHYGPTECTVVTTASKVSPTIDGSQLPSIGKPIANTQVYVLDPNRQPVPVGVAGELYIGGTGIARGYINQAEQNEQRFIAKPLHLNVTEVTDPTDGRLYRSGDRVRWRSDGKLDYMGRYDQQLMLRGFRIEPAEIEAMLGSHPEVRECLIQTCNIAKTTHLVAYILTPTGYSPPTSEALTEWVRARMPAHMVPSRFIFLNEWPLTENGKVDRKHLPQPSQTTLFNTEHVAPSGPAETAIARVWGEVLDCEPIGANDRFIDLGGNSLSAVQVVSRLNTRFTTPLTLDHLFNNPSVAETARLIEPIKPETMTPQSSLNPSPIAARETAAASIPLTEAQREIWFATQMGSEASMAYNESAMIHLRGELQIELLRNATAQLVERHEALRTTFSRDGDYQQIAPSGDNEIAYTDLIHERADSSRILHKIIHPWISEPFDLEHGPMWKVFLVRLEERHHVLLLVTHHIVCDGWSLYLLIQELGKIYSALSRNEDPGLPPADTFSSYAQHQVEVEPSSKAYRAAENYWLKRFAYLPPDLDLPTSHPRPATRNYTAAQVCRKIPPQMLTELRRVATEHSCSLFMVLFAGFSSLLHRLTGQDDLVIGVPVASQVLSGRERLVGHCANLLPLRSQLKPSVPFSDFLAATRETTFDAFDAWRYPFGQLLRKLNLSNSSSRVPLANVMFNLSSLKYNVELEGLEIDAEDIPKKYLNFDISLNLIEDNNGLDLACRYSAELFERADIERFLEQYVRFLEAISNHPEQSVSQVSLLSETERQRQLVEWNDSAATYPRNSCLHEQIAEQIEKTPDAVAVETDGENLTYRELGALSDQMAARLRASGVGPGHLVGLCVKRSPAMIWGALAILKTGAAYIPLDPSYPTKRIATMINDAQAPIVVTEQRLLDTLPKTETDYCCIDEPLPDLHIDASAQQSKATDPAYVIYTSGSTGKPKGVVISHRSVVNFLHSMQRKPGFAADDVILALTTLSFDIAVLELFLPLISGGRVALATREQAQDAVQLMARIEDSGANVIQATPATWRMLLAAGWKGSNQLRLLCGGEALPRDLANRLLRCGKELWNLYGPTETTVWSSVARVTPGNAPIVIGEPIANTQLHILDPQLQLVPAGVLGELFIGGDGLATGYLHRSELTAKKFLPNPFKEVSCDRIYRTGDRARRLSNGDIEVLGRLDTQIKLRGYRIELGEIESALRTVAHVREAVVMIREDTPGDPKLVAYLKSDSEDSPSLAEMREHLRQTLPDDMLPSAFVRLEKLPMTPNGKINRQALPKPEAQHIAKGPVSAPPRTPIEKELAEIWMEVLQINEVGINDNFFTLGGHSLLATQVLVRVRKIFDVELPFRRLFDDPTIARLASSIEEEFEQSDAVLERTDAR